ncbi:MAG: family 10 glycosylhydrolase [Muribaculaceae bacterium]|nr:family 10 glycosylhydrolase [Muribaculaceae bacterium]
MRNYKAYIAAAALLLMCAAASARAPKREMRGAWLHTVYQEQYLRSTTADNQARLRRQLDSLQAMGVNAVIFQVRPQADAFYDSPLEPWSCYLTRDGRAPRPAWDPLAFMVGECHARGMELHAWLNPYRVTAGARQTPAAGHLYHRHPERFVRYAGKIYFDPGLPANREHICRVVADIVDRYDVDGIHFDDYFYPYPVKGKDFPDGSSYARHGRGMKRDDWRRANVDSLIAGVHRTIRASRRPWVRFGVSPFGIWRNASSDPRGSATSGLENYDGLYADVLLWARRGWVDYLMPQLYWELDHKAASYRVLVDWWADNACGRHIYVGQDVERTMRAGELSPKMDLQRRRPEIGGHCWWPGYALCRGEGGVADSLASTHQSARALVPSYPWIASEGPWPVAGVSASGRRIVWSAAEPAGAVEDAVRFVVYRFDSPDAVDLNDASAIVAVTPRREYEAVAPGWYVVTALDRANNESAPSDPVRCR